MMHVLHPNVRAPSFALMSGFRCETDEDVTIHREFLTRGGAYFAHLTSEGPVPGGQFVGIRVGTRSVSWSFTDDVSLHSKSAFHWLISAVHVRIAP